MEVDALQIKTIKQQPRISSDIVSFYGTVYYFELGCGAVNVFTNDGSSSMQIELNIALTCGISYFALSNMLQTTYPENDILLTKTIVGKNDQREALINQSLLVIINYEL